MSLHTVSVLVQDRPGVLTRVAGLFARRGFNIHSLAVGNTEEPGLSRMTIVVDVQAKPLEQVEKQLHKLIDVLKVVELDPAASVERELALVKVRADAQTRPAVLEIAQIFRARVVDVSHHTLTLEVTGSPDKVEALAELLRPYGIVELVRTGRVALARGDAGIRERPARRVRAAS
ncbi:MAG TPA: acetolactate synthase small subunit [Actinomycetota bacterium]|nr:acetolactate synthase small subunit [Actinomycetota bacterium]